jgi:osmotically-inducible protein OsmY
VTERFSSRATVYLAVLLMAAPLSGCIVPLVAGTAVGGYTLLTQERSPEQLARDAAIAAAAHKYWADASSDLARDLSATTYNNDLLITGIVPNQQMKDAGERLARQIQGIGKIYNEVQVGQPTNFGQDARDNYVSNALRAQLLGDAQVRSSNYTVHTLNGIVYIMGYARNAAERDLVLSYARNLSNVQQVKSYIQVGNETGSAPASSSSPPSPSSSGNGSRSEPAHRPLTDDTTPPAAAPRGGPIEVQPIQ